MSKIADLHAENASLRADVARAQEEADQLRAQKVVLEQQIAMVQHGQQTYQRQCELYRQQLQAPRPPEKRRMSTERRAITHRFRILTLDEAGQPADHRGYLTVGFYEDGSVGEIFVKMDKQGGQVSGFLDAWAIATSKRLQAGAPLEEVVRDHRAARFEPCGRTDTPGIRFCTSPVDYVVRYLNRKFIEKKELVDDELPQEE